MNRVIKEIVIPDGMDVASLRLVPKSRGARKAVIAAPRKHKARRKRRIRSGWEHLCFVPAAEVSHIFGPRGRVAPGAKVLVLSRRR